MKKFTKTLIIASFVIVSGMIISLIYTPQAHSNSTGAPQGRTGSPGDGMSCMNGCHTGSNNPTTLTGIISSNVPGAGYTPGTTYSITVSTVFFGPTIPQKYGFQASVQNTSGTQLGTLAVTNASETQLVGGTKYITHTQAGTAPSVGPKSWTFNWTAPAAGTGTCTVFASIVLGNGDGTNSGDLVGISSLTIQEAVNGVDEMNYANLWNIYPNPVTDKIKLTNVSKTNNVVSLKIVDVKGRVVKSISEYTPNLNQEIDITELSKGIYFVNIISENGIATKKIIKN